MSGIFWAVFFHGTFDFLLFLQGNQTVTKITGEGLLFLGAVASFLVALALSRKAIAAHTSISKNLFDRDRIEHL
jgi:hypothetical protein